MAPRGSRHLHDLGTDTFHDGMGHCIGRGRQCVQPDRHAEALEPEHFLEHEGLGELGKYLDQQPDRSGLVVRGCAHEPARVRNGSMRSKVSSRRMK